MKFTETTQEEIFATANKRPYKNLKDDLDKFLATGYRYAKVEDTEGHYNNNNDLRRAIQACINLNNLPIVVFMYKGLTYVENLTK